MWRETHQRTHIFLPGKVPDAANDSSTPVSSLNIFFGAGIKVKTSEVALYSFSDIVGAVGGSLGLFLGFSCLDSGKRFLDWLFLSLRKKRPKIRK